MRTTALRIGLQSLRLHPLRTLLSTLGVVIGCASVSAVLALGDGAESLARQRLAREGLARVSLEALTSELVDGHQVPRTRWPRFTADDAEAIARAVPESRVTLEVAGTALTTDDGPRRAVLLQGRWLTGVALAAPTMAAGRFLTTDELREGAPMLVLSEPAARALVGEPIAGVPGTTLTLGGRTFDVVGVLGGDPGSRSRTAIAPLAAAEDALVPVSGGRAAVVHLDVTRAEEAAGARLRLERFVGRRQAWAGQTRIVSHGPARLREVAQALLVMKLLLGAFASISLVVGGIGIMNVLLASVTERTREVGIRKACGARRRDILGQFLAEAMAISTSGAVIGVVVGLTTAHVVTALVRARTEALLFASVTPASVLASVGVALVVGMVFGTYPAVRAARLPPIDAILRE